MANTVPLGVGLYGTNGHQVQRQLEKHPSARLVATCDVPAEALPESLRGDGEVQAWQSLDGLLRDPRVDLISFCSRRRADQAKQCIAALKAGKHVYAEKPCALTEADLDAILDAAASSGRIFHEMAGTAFEEPYFSMRQVIAAGTIGNVVQVLAQKSYPWHERRPSDECVDGGLTMQVGVHAARMVEHVAGVRVEEVQAVETTLGDPAGGLGLRMAAGMLLTLENGGIASVIANYLNPKGIGRWGNEELRVFGTEGMLEATDGGTRTRLIVGKVDRGAIPTGSPKDFFSRIVDEITRGEPMPLTLEQELHPTRVVIRASECAKKRVEAPHCFSVWQART
jgi:predicted dehydrogenase